MSSFLSTGINETLAGATLGLKVTILSSTKSAENVAGTNLSFKVSSFSNTESIEGLTGLTSFCEVTCFSSIEALIGLTSFFKVTCFSSTKSTDTRRSFTYLCRAGTSDFLVLGSSSSWTLFFLILRGDGWFQRLKTYSILCSIVPWD